MQLSNPRYVLPASVDQGKLVEIEVNEVIECGSFYAQIEESQYVINVLRLIHEHLNSPSYKLRPLVDPKEDDLCAAHFVDSQVGKCLYRARICKCFDSFKPSSSD